MKAPITLLFALLFGSIHAQTFQDFITHLNNTPAPDRQAKVDSFYSANTTLPYIEFDTVCNFVYKKSGGTIALAGDMNDWSDTSHFLTKVPSTNLYHLTQHYEPNARLDYKFVENGSNWVLDPKNPNTIPGAFGPNSELAMPQYVQPWEIKSYPGVPQGSIANKTIQGGVGLGVISYKVYTPPGYDQNGSKHYPTLYIHDGDGYLQNALAANVIDNLLDSNKIHPFIAIFINPNDRNNEYAYTKRQAYQDFVTKKLIPHIDTTYLTINNKYSRGVMGLSLGGNISTLLAYNNPELFYKLGLHSSVQFPNNFEATLLMFNSAHQHMYVASIWGTYEPSVDMHWKTVQDSLDQLGFTNTYYNVYPEAHTFGLWRATLDEILMHLFPPGSLHQNEDVLTNTDWFYPNPSKNKIYFTKQLDDLKIIDQLGRVVLHQQDLSEVAIDHLPEGIYMLRCSLDGGVWSSSFIKE